MLYLDLETWKLIDNTVVCIVLCFRDSHLLVHPMMTYQVYLKVYVIAVWTLCLLIFSLAGIAVRF